MRIECIINTNHHMGIRSENHPKDAATPVGFLRAASRGVVELPGLAKVLAVLLVAALCFLRGD